MYLEAYTSILGVDKAKLVRRSLLVPFRCRLSSALQEALYGKPVQLADRERVEQARVVPAAGSAPLLTAQAGHRLRP